MKLVSHLPRQTPWLYIVPLLNVVLLLLVFFLFSSGLVIQSGVSVSLPKSSSRLTGFDRAHIITIPAGDDSPLYYDGKRVSLVELREALERDKKTDRRAIIHSDQRVPHGRTMQIANEALALGFDVAFATTPVEADPVQ
jgi:biopolymer transport protein ExbD